MLFALTIVPVLGFVGAAVDYSRANAARAAMQGALDSAALMVSKDAAGTELDATEVNRRARAYFAAQFKSDVVGDIVINAALSSDPKVGSRLKIDSSAKMNTQFMKVVGFPELGIAASTATTWGGSRMRVAIALDVTGSMNSSGKLKAMKTAANELIDTLNGTAKNAEDVYISIIPFAHMVNIGPQNQNASWVKWDYYDQQFDSQKKKYATFCSTMNCTAPRNDWLGCVTDRDEPADTTRVTATSAATRFPATFYVEEENKKVVNKCVPKIVPMTSAYAASNVKTLKDNITALVAVGGTNQAIGMAWAWLTLQSNGPFSTPVKDTSRKYTDAIILLSDGENTMSRNYGTGTRHSPEVDARQKLLCQNIRASSDTASPIQIFTIQVNTTGDPESQVLKYCADPGSFYQTTSATGIAEAFQQIGQSLSKLRIAE